jgi:glucose-6-phosphate isomerase
MESFQFKYVESCGVSNQEFEQLGKRLKPEIKRLAHALTTGYASEYASINMLTDQSMLDHVQHVVQEKKILKPTLMIVIGIGGSNLGAKALYEAFYGTINIRADQSKIHVYWADTVDSQCIHAISQEVVHALDRGQNILLVIISKSGATTETIVNAQIFLNILMQKRSQDYLNYVVAITDKDSKLWQLAQQEKFVCLEIPKKVGGRFSVFSAAGLFPLAMADINIEQLVNNARFVVPEYTDEQIFNNPAAISAAILAFHYQQGINIHDTFLFSPNLESLGKWYRQLLGESIGKEFSRDGHKVDVGITPTVSIGSTDLHSVGQLYLGGPKDKVTTFVSIDSAIQIQVPEINGFDQLVSHIQNKELSSIMAAIEMGVKRAYLKKELPFVSCVLHSKWHVAQFMQFKMLEIIYLGFLLEVNPFDQPQVELYKEETRELLKQ